jgi:hypothetical protein
MRLIRITLGLLGWLVVFAIVSKVGAVIIGATGALALGAFDIHVTQNANALADLEAAANILSFLIGLGLGLWVYRKITGGQPKPFTLSDG